ncbi:MAG: TIGR02679 family protein [Burkholderiales bacterium]|nr:TIGR02679 family protein [Burkholderiales bacterium]
MNDERLQGLLGGAELAALRARLRAAYERVAVNETPSALRLARLTAAERDALAALSGRPPRAAASIEVDPVAVGARLAGAGLARDLRDALERLDGPIRAVAAERSARQAAWTALARDEPNALLRDWLGEAPNRGLLKRLAGADPEAAAGLLEQARRVLGLLPAPGWPRSRLAAQALGDAHALDDGAPAATLVLAALRQARAPQAEEGDEDRRARWAAVGVSVNELARPALTLNLPAADGVPAYWSLRRLLRDAPPWAVRGRDVFVCENPNLVAMVADQLGPLSAPLVCTDGMPAAAQRLLLAQLADSGARLHYHGDFDWAGLSIANLVLRELAAQAWRMEAGDYEQALSRHGGLAATLAGTPVEASWSTELGAAMQATGRALPEEAVAEDLFDDLRCA